VTERIASWQIRNQKKKRQDRVSHFKTCPVFFRTAEEKSERQRFYLLTAALMGDPFTLWFRFKGLFDLTL
jgi:hypothetical protein